ncbi:MAG: hypothetical protein KC994_09495 [Candidatus Omnitrophica bacterium]|nr:hypothetical protein [Candidatus Omnitrophota bacterium]
MPKPRRLRLPNHPDPWIVFSTLGRSGVANPGIRYRVVADYEPVEEQGFARHLFIEKLVSSQDGSSQWEEIDAEDLSDAMADLLHDLLDERLTVKPTELSARRAEKEG